MLTDEFPKSGDSSIVPHVTSLVPLSFATHTHLSPSYLERAQCSIYNTYSFSKLFFLIEQQAARLVAQDGWFVL